ncbi:MAG TPA: hypothetical protein VK498_11500 [Ferruginibacter sp.]|nr:hypothetical protein [Ferruginibacter sp.]
MATTKIKYSPSINITRDSDYDFNYIVTPNSSNIFSRLFDDVLIGIKAHNIIGAYGIGKSSFLLATQQTLTKKKLHFKGFDKLIKQVPKYEFVNIVGEYSSLIDCFAECFAIPNKKYTSNDILKAITNKYSLLKKEGKGLAIIIDEFGKFLEYAASHKPEADLYFIQQLAELVNSPDKDMLLITSLHQNFNAYAVDLNKSQQQEWDKVKGRLKDIVFNEPVEQLLFLAAERIHQKFPNSKPDNQFDKLFDCIQKSKAFPLRNYLEKGFAKKLVPFDILSAAVLTLSLQKYGQNERSLFSFIEGNDYLNVNEPTYTNYYGIPQVYNYLINNFHPILSTSKNNPHFNQWSAIRQSLEKMEGVLKEDMFEDAAAIIKTIGLLNIFSSASGKLDIAFYTAYAKLSLGIKNADKVIKELDKFKIINYTKHNFRYSLLAGTDVDIDLAIDEAGRMVEMVTDVTHHLNQYFDFPFIPAKSVSYRRGTSRFFQFKLSEEPIQLIPEGEVDGFINLIFSEDPAIVKKIQDISRSNKEAILYGHYTNTKEIKILLYEIQKIATAIANHKNDRDAVKEFTGVEKHYRRLLNHYVLDSLYSNQQNIAWFYQGTNITVTNKQTFNQTLSTICEQVYTSVPTFRNELMNKSNISGGIASARKKLLERLLSNSSEENIGFTPDEFPPEKSIYLTLLKKPGIHRDVEGAWQLDRPLDMSFNALWDAGENFLASTRGKERSLQEVIDLLSSRPFKLKQGFIDYWVPLFLLIKNNEYAIYENDIYLPELSVVILDLINKKPGLFKIKAFDVVGIKLQLFNRYRILLNQTENNKPNNKTFIQTISPFLNFYRSLQEYSKKTNRLSKQTIALRTIISKAKDPEKTFFEDFPTAFGYSLNELQKKSSLAESFISQMQASITELRTAYDELVTRFEDYFVKDVIGSTEPFPAYRNEIRGRFKSLKIHMLLTQQKSFYNRLQSELDDRTAWLSSMAQACVGKPLSEISDEEELLLFDKLKDIVYELDNMCDVSNAKIDNQNEEVLKLEITSLVQGLNKGFLRISKEKSQEIEDKQQEIKRILGKDKKINLAVLGKLIQELLIHE